MTDTLTRHTARASRSGERRTLRSAIVGGGMIGAVHRGAVRAAGGELAGVLGSTPARGVALGEKWETTAYPDLDALLGDDDVDVVHICSPNDTHAPIAIAAMRAGKHVICEKPIATSVAQAEEMVAVQQETGVVATVPFAYRFHPIVRELRARRIRGDFGRLFTLHGQYLQDWMLSPAAGNWRVDAAAGGASRAFGDIGSHWCDIVEFVSGERFAELSAETAIAIPERPLPSAESFTLVEGDAPTLTVTTEDTAAVTLRTASGVLGNVVVSQVAGGRRNRLWFEMDAANGSAVFDQEHAETAWLGSSDGATVIARGTGPQSADAARLAYVPGGHAQSYQDCFTAFVADTYRAVRGEAPEGLPMLDDGLRSARIVDAVIRSSVTRQWVEVGTP